MSDWGASEMQRALEEAARAYQQKAASALYQEGEQIMTRSKQEFVPVDLGTLRDSGQVALPVIDPDGTITVELSYGGAAAAYALAVHENPSEHDPPSWEGVDVQFKTGGPKFLELPLNEALDGMDVRLAEALKS